MKSLGLAGMVALMGLAGAATAQPIAMKDAKPLMELLGSNYTPIAVSPNGRPGEVVMIVKHNSSIFACVLSEVRGKNYGEADPKPVAQPCLPLNP